MAPRTALPPEESTWLRERLIQYFDDEELRTLCSDLGVEYDSLPGKGKEAKARELVAYLGRRGRIPALIEMCIRLRPHVDWEETTHVPPPVWRFILASVVVIFIGLLAWITLGSPTSVSPLTEIFPQVGYGEDFVFTALGGKLDTRYNESDRCRHSGTFGLQLVYAMSGQGNGGWGVHWDNAPTKNLDASGFSALALWVKGSSGSETFQIGLRDTDDREVKVESEPLVLVSASEWRQVKVELGYFRDNGVNVASLKNLNFGFNRNHGSGMICIDDIAFE